MQVHKAQVKWSLIVPVLVNDVLKHKGLVYSAVLRPVPCLGRGPELMLFSEFHQLLSQNASVQPA